MTPLPALLRCLALAAALGADGPAPLAGTEERLARAGVPAAMRDRVLASLDRAGDWLAARQREDGSFAGRGDVTWLFGQDPGGITPLCGLALEHAGKRAAAGSAIRWISPDGESARREIMGHAYAAGLALRLLRDHGGNLPLVDLLARNLAASQEPESGWWAWRWTKPGVPFGILPGAVSAPPAPGPDLVSSRYAVEGLAAAEAAGWRAPAGLWKRLLDGLAASQQASGAFSLVPRGTDEGGTLHGISCFSLGADALRRRGELPASTARALDAALDRARAALRVEGERILGHRGRTPRGTPWGTIAAYDLAAACAAAGSDEVGGRDAWTILAGDLLDTQDGEGSWKTWDPRDELVATSFAVLLLSRSCETLRPEAPPIPRPAPAAPPVWPEPGALPPLGRIPLRDAEDALELLRTSLADPSTPVPAVAAALRLVGRCLGRIGDGEDGRPATEEEALDWHRRAEAALLRALVLGREDPTTGRRTGAEAARVAALLLGTAHPRVVPGLREALEDPLFKGRGGDPERRVLAAAFGALARHGGLETAEWLLRACLSTEGTGPRAERCLEALGAMAVFEGLDRAARRECVARIVGAFEGLEAAAPLSPGDRGFQPGAKERWALYRVPVLDALQSLGRDPATGAPALDRWGNAATTVAGFRQWLGR
ncbi:MAG: hypothetical protein L6R43_08720 [Planctomycetes bacterium]|nr:hypothetical protein [Planctomycetota bacterium]